MRKGDLTRLIRILGMLGSDHVGERAAAALAADKLVRGGGWSWSDLLAPSRPSRPARTEWGDPLTDRLAAAESRMRQLRSENARLQEEVKRLKRRLDLRSRPFRPAEAASPPASGARTAHPGSCESNDSK
ncbi:hypothetical protein [Inquilinus limosus]|uniref:hypothetical protein n=1 Tax=Inquilinus limosus TaxID=171674 RepID=UPI000419A6A0|nr:hypothetical protein [Inquilinus limosus]